MNHPVIFSIRIIRSLILSVILLSNVSTAQSLKSHSEEYYLDIAEKMSARCLMDLTGYDWLSELCDIGPRLSGSEKSLEAIYWAEKKLRAIYCDSVWLQPVMVPHWDRGEIEKGIISQSEYFKGKKLSIASLGSSIGTPAEGITAEVIEVKSLDEAKSLGKKAEGKIIFYNRPFDYGLLRTFNGYGSAVDQRIWGAVEGAKVGAVGVLVRSITSKYDNVPHVGVMAQVDSVKAIPGAAIGLIDADFLSDAIKKEPHLKITLNMDCKNFPDAQSFNVIGEIRGTEFPNEVVVVGGHFDSWDKGCGAHDDGAPCIQTMEVLDLLKRLNIKPKRTIRCVLFINEENGTRGGIEYGKFALESNEIHVAAIESDRGAYTPRGFTVSADSLTLIKMKSWESLLKPSLIEYIIAGYGGVDINRIENTKALIGYDPDNQRYMDVHHSSNDTFDAVNPREMELGTAAIAMLAYLISVEGL
ncbi:M20/M25/M40 family metallo-hydrolase [Bacteroidota bacterium]